MQLFTDLGSQKPFAILRAENQVHQNTGQGLRHSRSPFRPPHALDIARRWNKFYPEGDRKRQPKTRTPMERGLSGRIGWRTVSIPIPGRCPGLREGGPFGPQARENRLSGWQPPPCGPKACAPSAQPNGLGSRPAHPTSIQAPTGRDISALASVRGSETKGQHELGGLTACRSADRDHRMSLRPDPVLPVRVGEERILREDDLDLARRVADRGDVDMNVSRDLPVPIAQPHCLRIAAGPDRVELELSILVGSQPSGETGMRLIHGLAGCIAAAGVGLVDVQPGAGHGLAVLAADAAVDREPLPRLRVADQGDGVARRRSRPLCDCDNESSGKDGKWEPEGGYGARLPGCESDNHMGINGDADKRLLYMADVPVALV